MEILIGVAIVIYLLGLQKAAQGFIFLYALGGGRMPVGERILLALNVVFWPVTLIFAAFIHFLKS